jgi:hypothetical protein
MAQRGRPAPLADAAAVVGCGMGVAECAKKEGETVLAQSIVIALRLGSGPSHAVRLRCERPEEERPDLAGGSSTPPAYRIGATTNHQGTQDADPKEEKVSWTGAQSHPCPYTTVPCHEARRLRVKPAEAPRSCFPIRFQKAYAGCDRTDCGAVSTGSPST